MQVEEDMGVAEIEMFGIGEGDREGSEGGVGRKVGEEVTTVGVDSVFGDGGIEPATGLFCTQPTTTCPIKNIKQKTNITFFIMTRALLPHRSQKRENIVLSKIGIRC
jgi:hypothetical protein